MKMRINASGAFLTLLAFLSFVSLSESALAAMSVDFGSQFIKVALVKPGVPMEIVLNKESRRKTPNICAIKNGERFFGDSALAFAVKHPTHSFAHLLDLLGKKVDNPVVELYKERFPFAKIVPDEARGTVQFSVDGELFGVETLVAMILSQARAMTEEFAEQPVKDVVITVPAFFNQAERRAMVSAAEIAGLNLLQLLNDHSAAGLSYGIFRRKEITEKAQTLLIYDMGSTKTTASILEYKLQKDKKTSEKNPVMSTLGIGYDRTLGGLEVSLRMRDHLVNEFKKQKKMKEDITKNPRSMAKMLKEAERVKQVLSANADHFAQVENLHEEHDFKVRVSREELENMIKDLEPRIIQPILDALMMAEMDIEQVDQVVLMGAGTRIPRIQAIIQGFFKSKELGKFLNTDESIAMGAVYQAAHLSKGFKVKRFDVQDLQIFPIQVDFLSVSTKNAAKAEHIVRRPIFGYKSFFPTSRKILSFTSYTKDFSFNINYGELKHLNEKQLREFGSLNISDVELSGITEAVQSEMANEGTLFKGVKAHFSMDDSGVVHVESAEVLVERPHKEESAFASFAGRITGLFSSGSSKDSESKEEKKEDNQEEVQKVDKEDSKETKEEEDQKSKGSEIKQPSQSSNETGIEGTSTTEEKKISTNATESDDKGEVKGRRPKTVKISLKVGEKRLDVNTLSDSEAQVAKRRLSKYEELEKAKAEREAAHNSLESLVYDISDKLEQPEMQAFITDNERSSVQKELTRIRTWLEDDVGIETTTEEFLNNRRAVDTLLKPINWRIREHNERPSVVSDLMSLLNHTEFFLVLGKNLTEAEILTEVEISMLEKVLNETKAWWEEKNASQIALKPTDTPAYTVEDVKDKIRSLDREVKYLLNKMKYSKPKVKKNETAAETKANDTAVPEETERAEDVNATVGNAAVEDEPSKAKAESASEEAPDAGDSESSHDASEL